MNLNVKEYFLKIKHNTPILFWLYIGLFLCPFFVCGIWKSYDLLVNDGDLVVAFGITLPPYSSYGTSAKHNHGFDYSIAYFVAQRLHKNLKIKELSFDESIKALNAGTIDMVCASLSITDERLANMAMVHVYGCPTPYIAMMFWNSPLYKALTLSTNSQGDVTVDKVRALLKNTPIGILAGSVWESVLKKYAFTNIKSYTYEQDIIAALELGKISAAVTSEFSIKFLQKQNPNIQWLEVALDAPWSYGGGIAIKKGRTDLIKNITEVIQDLKDEGIIRQEQLRWFGRVCK